VIANFNLIGYAPIELSELTITKLSLVSRSFLHCQTWVFYAGCHQQIKGWHTFFKGRPSENVADLSRLVQAGLKGSMLVVLCGPFTKAQIALTRSKMMVSPEKVIRAYKWLIENNVLYQNDIIPNIDDIPIPIIIHDKK
jgi:hypothetical protein